MKIKEIIKSKKQGIKVYYMTTAYEVLLDPNASGDKGTDYSIGYGIGTMGENWIGMTDIYGNIRNGEEELFFIIDDHYDETRCQEVA